MSATACPVKRDSVIFGAWFWPKFVDTVGIPVELDGEWLCPVRYTNRKRAVVRVSARIRANGREQEEFTELQTGNAECDRAISVSSDMPEIVNWTKERCLIRAYDHGAGLFVEVTFAHDHLQPCARLSGA